MRAFATLSVSLCVLAIISLGVAAPALQQSSYEDRKSPKSIECHEGKRYYEDEHGKIEECYKYKDDPKKDLHQESYKPEECQKGKRYYKGEDGKKEDCHKYKYNYDPKEDFLRGSPKPMECHKGKRYYKRDGKIEECRKYKHDSKKDSLRVRAGSFLSPNNTVPSVIPQVGGNHGNVVVSDDGADVSYDIYNKESELGYGYDVFYYDDAGYDGTTLTTGTTTTMLTSIQWQSITAESTESASPEVIPDGEDLTAVPPTTALLSGLLNVSFEVKDPALPQILIKNASHLSTTSTSASTTFHPTSVFDAAPSAPHPTANTHLPFNSSPSHSTIGHLSASLSTHAPTSQRPSSPIPHHPPGPLPSHSISHDSNSSDTSRPSPFHQHPPPKSNNAHSGPSVAQIFFEALGGVIGLVVVLAVARCFYIYRKTPASRRPPTPDIGEVERTMALLRPGRILNLGDRAVPPPPYQPAPDYDSVVATPSIGTSTTTNLSPACSTPTGVTQTRSVFPVSVPASASTSSSVPTPQSQESIPPNLPYRPPAVQVSV
ncbi:hypothetical protein Clacol_001723 [Clathrus columnatus]|uniref:Uncharacterized protein n=1 Tax=Clathrus columnatus TaxID=1419009 RepID=A0AAV5A4J6_9AGAM|nr:hypothetical protein Clacol_001723 [Clathrus columnatus]